MISRRFPFVVALVATIARTVVAPAPATAQQSAAPADSRLTVDRIYRSAEFRAQPTPQFAWLRDGRSYIETRPAQGGGAELVRVDIGTRAEERLVPASALIVDRTPLDIEDLTLSDDESQALLFHHSERVWRQNTRGTYHVVDLKTGRLIPTAAAAGGQMFAKLSPDGKQIAFVRGNDLWVTDLATGRERRLTTDGSADIINGTSDWVYEEEFGLRDAFRWSPDGKHIAYWRFDQSAVPAFPLVNELGLYPEITTLRYPKAGQPNSRVKVGVVHLTEATPRTTWLQVGPDTGQYVARMGWASADSVWVVRLPRRQNVAELMMLSGTTGSGRVMFTDRDSAYVDIEHIATTNEGLQWVNGGREFLWLSDRSGWRQLWLVARDGRSARQLTQDGMDVMEIASVDAARGSVYVRAAAPTPLERNYYRVSLRNGVMQRITPERGTHTLSFSPGARFAVGQHSAIDKVPTSALYELPSMRRLRTLTENTQLASRVAALGTRPPQLLRVPGADGTTMLDAWRIVPANWDSTRKHPVLMFVYGGPAAPQVNDAWGGTNHLWFQMLAQQGYVVMAVDNRGAAWRGRDFRKTTQFQLGVKESDDQIAAARWIGGRPWGDARRIGMFGWSYGGFLTSMAMTRGGDVFKAGIAVAPVTDWRLYDTIYTERFMGTPQENPEGYRAGAPQTHAAGLTGRLLLVHGTGDDNVHSQNTIQFADKLEAAGKQFDMLLYPNRSHGIAEGGVTPQLRASLTRFILERL